MKEKERERERERKREKERERERKREKERNLSDLFREGMLQHSLVYDVYIKHLRTKTQGSAYCYLPKACHIFEAQIKHLNLQTC